MSVTTHRKAAAAVILGGTLSLGAENFLEGFAYSHVAELMGAILMVVGGLWMLYLLYRDRTATPSVG